MSARSSFSSNDGLFKLPNASDYTVLTESSSLMTSSSVVGIGRTMGRLFSMLGRALENTFNRYFEGNGPWALMQRIDEIAGTMVIMAKRPSERVRLGSVMERPTKHESTTVEHVRPEDTLLECCRRLLSCTQLSLSLH